MTSHDHTRRRALKLLGSGAAALSARWAGATSGPWMREPRPAFFALKDVRLGDGPFLDAQKLDAAYLLRLEPDRLLANFRLNAGLAVKAPVYGGWESVEPWIWIRCHGHTLGHYLGAAACMYESTGDARFAERVDYIVDELAACQEKRGNGLLTAFPDDAAPLLDSLAGKEFAGVPWYTMHKVMAGLRDAHVHRGSVRALEVLKRLADWIVGACAGVPDDRFQKMLDREHGGMNEVLADLAAIAGNSDYLQLALRFSHRALLDPLARGEDVLDGLHANTQIPKVVGFSRIYEVTAAGWPEYDRAARFFWDTVVNQRSFATGGHGDGEHFFPKRGFVEHLGSAKTMETCCTHNMLRLTRSLYSRDPRAEYFDYFERALFNGILASQDPETGMNTYFQATRPGYVRLYHTPFDSFWCCTGSGLENHARYGESIYAADGDALYVNLFIASSLEWRDRGITITQATNFPDADTTTLRVAAAKSNQVVLRIRHPAWCPTLTVRRGKRVMRSRRAGTYVEVDGGPLRAGESVEIRFPMSLAIQPLPNAPDHAALRYGPIVLAARLGTAGLTPGSQLIVNERESGNMLNEPVDIPRWTRPLGELPASLERIDKETLRFRTNGFAGGAPVEFIPYFRLSRERYNLYWRQG